MGHGSAAVFLTEIATTRISYLALDTNAFFCFSNLDFFSPTDKQILCLDVLASATRVAVSMPKIVV